MPTTKTSTLTFRVEPKLKESLRAAAARERRSLSNMVEVMILDYCDRIGVSVTSQAAAKPNKKKTR